MFGLPVLFACAMLGSSEEPVVRHRYQTILPHGLLAVGSEHDQQRVIQTAELYGGDLWTEAILSWTASAPAGAGLTFEVRGIYPDHTTRWYTLAYWTEDQELGRRESRDHQRDADGDVQTDTLILKRPGARLQIRVTERSGPNGDWPRVGRLDLVTSTPGLPSPRPSSQTAWGSALAVPIRAQGDYEGGNVLCSPTSLSMLLAYWAKQLDQPALDHDVPEVQAGVYDREWKGTGNWAFNTAFAARQAGLRSYVTRLHDLRELEAWIERGVPVACSVSYDLLKGKGKRGDGDGHLVVVAGFTPEGDPVFNDPGKKPIRLTYRRADFDAAWATSDRAVYLVYPTTWAVPSDPVGAWDGAQRR